ncbi:MAG: ABC transporter permease [Micrococcales bacterium]
MKLSKRPLFINGAVALFALFIATVTPSNLTTIKIQTDQDFFKLSDIPVSTQLVTYVGAAVAIASAIAAALLLLVLKRKVPGMLTALTFVAFASSVVVYLYNGHDLTLTSLLQGSLALSVPLIFGSMAGVLSERVGVVNIAIEGQLLFGAFASAMIASMTHNLWVGLVGALVGGSLVAWILAVFSIRYKVDQIITGVVVNMLVVGLTNFLFGTLMGSDPVTFNQPPRFAKLTLPLLGQIPVIGPVLFSQTPIVYLMYIALAVVFVALFKTRWGLRVRAVGEYPKAADTVGINVFRTRYVSVVLGGALAGLGGSFFTLGQVGSFGQNITHGAGYIALAALIFGRWNPLLAASAALLFGFAQNLQYGLAIIGSPVPSEFLLMLPYVLTVVAVAGLVGKVTGPAASGKPYTKE